MTIQQMSDGTFRRKQVDVTHRQYFKKKGYTDKEIKEIEKKDIARGAKPGYLDKQMTKIPSYTKGSKIAAMQKLRKTGSMDAKI
ncbi:MAG: hypothetical protein KAT14_07480 [Candidatus Marinimicrobia bacterium]|nr:hypothetical protein [Candidatus Neomarinimicrobiota bacterium]